jgi:DNA-binding NarL/FixJ family response regulator
MFRRELYGSRVHNEQDWRVIKFVAQGLKNTEIAEAMGTTRYVIANHLRVLYDKLGLSVLAGRIHVLVDPRPFRLAPGLPLRAAAFVLMETESSV